MKLNEKEALRYLGFRGKPADADTDEMIREIGGEMLRGVPAGGLDAAIARARAEKQG